MTSGDSPLSPADFGWTDRVRLPQLWEPLLEAKARVSLGAVASAHHIASSREHTPEVREEAKLLRRCLRAKFEQGNGAIRNSYFCRNLPGGIALIEDPVDLQTVLNSENDRLLAFGSLRLVVGAIFGAVVHFGLGAGLLGATDRPVATVGVFAIVGFTAGFSERFAKDMVERAGQVLADGGPALGRSDDLPR